jgi:hypothetical protein
MLRKILMAVTAIAAAYICTAQEVAIQTSTPSTPSNVPEPVAPAVEKKPDLLITGSADFYYRYDFNKTKANNLTSFTNSHNAFSLGMASVKLEHKAEKIGAVLDLGFGTRAKEFAYNDEGVLQSIKQLYVTYSPAGWLKFTAGSWATHVGYELVDPQLNHNYSMSYLFTNGPFTHTGIKADITKGKHGFMIGVSNATDFRIPKDASVNSKFLIAQYSYAFTDNFKLYLNYVGGKGPDSAKSGQLDAVVIAKINNKFSLGANGTINNTRLWEGTKNGSAKSWSGAALYINLDPKPWFGLTLRSEYFSDEKQLKVYSTSSEGGSVFANTLSANFKVNAFTFIPEFRIDNASKKLFTNSDGAARSSFSSFVLATVYSF